VPTAPVNLRSDAKKSLIKDIDQNKRLQIQINKQLDISTNEADAPAFDKDGNRNLTLSQGHWFTKPDQSHFSCKVLYHINKREGIPAPDAKLTIKPGAIYQFQKTEAYPENPYEDSGETPYVKFKLDPAGSKSSLIRELTCLGTGGSVTVDDLIDAFGGDGKSDNTDIRIIDVQPVPATSTPTTPASPAAGAPRRSSALRHTLIQWPSIGHRMPASTELPQQVGQSKTEAAAERDYEYEMRPNFGIQFMGSAGAFGNSTISPAQQGIKSGAMLIQLEYEPRFLQSLGVLSIGPSVGMFPTLGSAPSGGNVTSNVFSIHELGGQARYQLHYWNDQFIVPYVAYEVQNVHYNINQGGSGSLTIAGGSAGLGVLLNRFASAEARGFHDSFGVSRSYLMIEGKNLQGSDQNVKVSGTSIYFGLRFER
jgi:hypothetical protein